MSIKHFPRFRDKVNDNRRTGEVNGFVLGVRFDDGPDEVGVRFNEEVVWYPYDEFRDTWTDAYGGVFLLGQASRAAQYVYDNRLKNEFLYQLKLVMEGK